MPALFAATVLRRRPEPWRAKRSDSQRSGLRRSTGDGIPDPAAQGFPIGRAACYKNRVATVSGRLATPAAQPPRRPLLHWAGLALVVASWISAAIFGAYILAFYGGAVPRGAIARWNETLPRLYESATPLATLAIGAHFVAGGALLLLGPIQLVGALRRALPALHRWTGRVYVTAAGVAGAGGLGFILAKGTVGGAVMSVGFGLYGALMATAAVHTWRHARARRWEAHRAWGIRLFALAIGSWLYRMDYGFWLMLTGGAGHARNFGGWFDHLMAFAFYLPNLAVAELFIRARRAPAHAMVRGVAAAALLGATGFVALGTYYFTLFYWGPGILR